MSTEMPNNFQAFRTTIYMVQTYIYMYEDEFEANES